MSEQRHWPCSLPALMQVTGHAKSCPSSRTPHWPALRNPTTGPDRGAQNIIPTPQERDKVSSELVRTARSAGLGALCARSIVRCLLSVVVSLTCVFCKVLQKMTQNAIVTARLTDLHGEAVSATATLGLLRIICHHARVHGEMRRHGDVNQRPEPTARFPQPSASRFRPQAPRPPSRLGASASPSQSTRGNKCWLLMYMPS